MASFAPDVTTQSSIASPTNIFYFLLIPALVLWYTYWRISRRRMIELAKKLPGPNGFWLFGNALHFLGSSHSKLMGKNYFYFYF